MGLSQQARGGKTTEKRRYACGHGIQEEKDKWCKISKNRKFGAVGGRPPVSLRTTDPKLENPWRYSNEHRSSHDLGGEENNLSEDI